MPYCKCQPKITDKCERCGEEKRFEPRKGETYFVPDRNCPKLFSRCRWQNNLWDMILFANNLVFRTKEEAIALAKKMLKAVE